MTEALPIDKVFTRKDARKIDEVAVGHLVESIRDIGLINPIRVRPTTRPDHPEAWEVIAGGHRLRAMRKLGFEMVPCVVVDDDDLHAELAMIDENLARSELSAADRSVYTARRKAIYLDLYPETKHGGNLHGSGVANLATRDSFVDATAAATGKSERTIQRYAEIGEKVLPEALNEISGTALDKVDYLEKLKKTAPEKQIEKVRRDLAAPRVKEPKVAADPLDDVMASERQVARLMDAWNAAGPEARQEFLLRIDTPVFDRGAAA